MLLFQAFSNFSAGEDVRRTVASVFFLLALFIFFSIIYFGSQFFGVFGYF